MPQMANVTLADGQSTPVNHTFNVVSSQQGATNPATWAERTAGTMAGEIKLTQLVATNATTRKVTIRLTKPTLDAEGVFSHQSMVSMTFVISDKETEAGRADLLAYISNYLASAYGSGSVVDGEPAY